jgi:hypothetical protein
MGAKADAKSTATDTTSVSAMSVWKQISASVQAIATSVAGVLAVSIADGSHVTFGGKTDAKSTATDATSVSGMQVWKQISASIQAVATSLAGTLTVASHAVTNAGTFAVQATEADGANTTLGAKADAKSTATDTTAVTIMSVLKQVSSSVQAIASSVAGTLTVGLPSGASTAANQSTELTRLGDVTETAPTTDTASSGLNGRLQRIAQRLTTLLAVFPTTIDVNSGNKSASTLRVVLATDQPQLTNALKVDGSAVTQPVSIADGSNATFGAKTDAKSTSTDSTSITAMQVWKQISASVQAIATSVAGTLTVGIAAGTALIGRAASSDETSTIYNGTTALTPKFAKIVASSSGATTIVAAVTSKKIRVVALQVIANAAVNVKWQSHVTPTDLTGLAYLAANGGYVLPYNPVGWCETVSGEALDINLSGAIAVGGFLTYVEV